MKSVFVAAALCLSASFAQAQTTGDTVISSGFTTLGFSVEGAYQVSPEYRVRGVFMGVPDNDALSDSFENGGTLYEYNATIGGIAALFDYYPSGPDWRFSGGVLISRTEFRGNAALSQDNVFTLDDGTVIDTGTARLDTTFSRRFSPLATVGYDYWFDDRWVFSGELGAIFIGGLSLAASSTNATLQAEIANDADVLQAEQTAQETTVLPYISFSVGYRF